MDLGIVKKNVKKYAHRVYKKSKIPSHDFSHVSRVVALSLNFGRKIGLSSRELDLLEIAAWLHDIAIAEYGTKENHAKKSAERARELLANTMLENELEEVVEAIKKHSWNKQEKPSTLIGKILQDADRLDAIGSIGIYRTIAYGIATGKKFYCEKDPFAEKRKLNDIRYTIDHFYTKLLKIPETLNTEIAKKEAKKRMEIMEIFLEELRRELKH